MKQMLCTLLAAVLLCLCVTPAWAAVARAGAEDESWMLQLVDQQRPLAKTFAPTCKAVQNDFVMDQRVAPVMRQMIADALEDGVELVVNSAYRSYNAQQRIFDARLQEYLALGYSAENAKSMTLQYVALPGYSEHQLGLAVDVVGRVKQASGGYAVDYEAKWLSAHAPDYGFIMRYPADKTAVTNAAYEPWHFRYVGKEAAKEMTAQGLCFEEYLAALETQKDTPRKIS